MIDPFLYNVPHIDIHGYDRYVAMSIVNNFIDNNLRLDIKKIVIVHWKCTGVLKHTSHKDLKNDKRVLDDKTNNYNDGETIVYLK